MTRIRFQDARLTITFRWYQKLLGTVHDVTIPRSSVAAITVPSEPREEVYGWHRHLGLRGVFTTATWHRDHRTQLVSLHRSCPAVKLWLIGQDYDEAVISTKDARVLHRALAAPQTRCPGRPLGPRQ